MTHKICNLLNITIALLLLLTLFGCNKISDSLTSYTPSIPVQNIIAFDEMNISIPSEYQKQSSESGNIVYSNDNSSIIISSQDIDPEHNTAESYSFYALTQYTKLFDEFSVSNESVFNLANTDAYVKEFSYKMYGDNATLEMNCLTAFIVYNNKTYVITCSSNPDSYEASRVGFTETVKSIYFSKNEKSAETSSVSTD